MGYCDGKRGVCSGALLQEPRRQRVTGDSNVAAAWQSAWARAGGCCVGSTTSTAGVSSGPTVRGSGARACGWCVVSSATGVSSGSRYAVLETRKWVSEKVCKHASPFPALPLWIRIAPLFPSFLRIHYM